MKVFVVYNSDIDDSPSIFGVFINETAAQMYCAEARLSGRHYWLAYSECDVNQEVPSVEQMQLRPLTKEWADTYRLTRRKCDV